MLETAWELITPRIVGSFSPSPRKLHRPPSGMRFRGSICHSSSEEDHELSHAYGVQLACARIGAVHSVVFGGFSAESLAGRILDSKPSVVLTASAVKRGAKPIDLKVPFTPSCAHYEQPIPRKVQRRSAGSSIMQPPTSGNTIDAISATVRLCRPCMAATHLVSICKHGPLPQGNVGELN